MKTKRSICKFTGPTTLFLRGGFGYRAILVREFEVEVGPYAQHPRAVFVTWLEKGKRNARSIALTPGPSLRGIIASGHGYPNQADCMKDQGGGCSMTRFASFAPEWDTEFDAWAAEHIPLGKRLVDLSKVLELSEEEAHAANG